LELLTLDQLAATRPGKRALSAATTPATALGGIWEPGLYTYSPARKLTARPLDKRY